MLLPNVVCLPGQEDRIEFTGTAGQQRAVTNAETQQWFGFSHEQVPISRDDGRCKTGRKKLGPPNTTVFA